MNIIAALRDRRMLGGVPAFHDLTTWKRWLVFLCAAYGLALVVLRDVGVSEEEALQIFKQHTGRTKYAPPPGGYPVVVAIVGRQAGKDRVSSAITDFAAISAAPEPDGTETYAVLVAQDQRSSLRTLFSYASAPFDLVPALSQMVPSGWRGLWQKARRVDSLTLSNGVRIAVYPCRPAALRGIRARVVVLNEFAFFRSSDGYPIDAEMLRAARPTLATTGGKLIVLSSPYAQSGALYDLHRRHFGRDDSTTLVWVATAPDMNPTLSGDYLERMAQDDPEGYRSEVLAEFRAGISTFLDPDSVAACVADGVRERAPEKGRKYFSFDDPASGSGKDAWTKAIAHVDGDRIVLDVLRTWQPPFNPTGIIAESADVGRSFGLMETTGDRYAPGFVLEGFRTHGITYTATERDRSAIYLELLPLVNAGRISLLEQPDLIRELRALERRRGATGRDRVDHPPGGHDDRANAAAGAIVSAALASARSCESPLCEDKTCDGQPPLDFYGSPALTAWLLTHPSRKTLAAFIAEETEADEISAQEERLSFVDRIRRAAQRLSAKKSADGSTPAAEQSGRETNLQIRLERARLRAAVEDRERLAKAAAARSADRITRAVSRRGSWFPGD